MAVDREAQSALWRTVAASLRIEVVAPASIQLDGGIEIAAAALVKGFGARNGMIADPDWSGTLQPVANSLRAAGYGYSAVEIDGCSEQGIIEMLRDWGWTGHPDRRPPWLG